MMKVGVGKEMQERNEDCRGRKMFGEKNETVKRTEDRNSLREKSLK